MQFTCGTDISGANATDNRISVFGLLSVSGFRISDFLSAAPALCALALLALPIEAAVLTVQTNKLGPTPEIIGYNLGHFFPGSNTRDWWRYAGVSGARVFVPPREIEAVDDLPGHGDGVTGQAGFLNRRAALRADPLNTNYINWPYFLDRYETRTFSGNRYRLNYAFSELRALNIQILANITAGLAAFPITGPDDWAGRWELWQHYYAQAFYLGREFDVQRFQMFNEPNHGNAGGITPAAYLERLQLASDAIQSALADVNALHGKSLTPHVFAPATAGSGLGSYPGWGDIVVTNRHTDWLGQTGPHFWLVRKYAYHRYNATPAAYGADLAGLHDRLTTDMAPEPRFPTVISEFNVHTAATFDSMTDTLDTPSKYSRLGAIAVHLMKNFASELYCFKFSQTFNDGTVKKNGMHYVDNTSAPYNIGTVTKAGEVWRLLNKGFAPGRERLGIDPGAGASGLNVQASHDPATGRYYIFFANDTATAVDLSVNLGAWNVPVGNVVLVEEVSENCYGAVILRTNVPNNRLVSGRQGANSVWLMTIPGASQADEQVVTASDNVMVKDGANRFTHYGPGSALWVRNNSTNAGERSVSFLKFQPPPVAPEKLQLALLTLRASSINGATAHAHVYGLANNNWSQTNLTWAGAPNLAQNVPPGVDYTNNHLLDAGVSAQLVGQLVAGNAPAERVIDVTDFLRNHPGGDISFLLVRQVGFYGDAQDDDGIALVSKENDLAHGPRLSLIHGSTNVAAAFDWTNVVVSTEAFVRGGAGANTDPDEAATGYMMVKHYASPFDLARKAYFEFDLGGLAVDGGQAIFTVNFTASFKQRVQLWALNQPYPGFNPNITWNSAQANHTTSNDLLTNGPFTAMPIGDSVLIPSSGTMPWAFTLPRIGDFLFNNRVTLVLSGVADSLNNAGGLRMERGNATLTVWVPVATAIPTNQITGIAAHADGRMTIGLRGTLGQVYLLEAATDLPSTNWTPLSTNVAPSDGAWTFTDSEAANHPRRFYRSVIR